MLNNGRTSPSSFTAVKSDVKILCRFFPMNKLLSKEYFVQPLFFSFSLTSNDVIVLQWSRLLFLRDKISSWKSLSFFSP